MTKKSALAIGVAMTFIAGAAAAQTKPTGIPKLDHVFVIVMENHGYDQIYKNRNAPFITSYASKMNLATNYFGVAHPSLTNYLEIVGGSNFGVLSDNYPDWHNTSCKTNLKTGIPATDNPVTGLICPIHGTGKDAATVRVDTTNETQGKPGLNNIDGHRSIPANQDTDGLTIADQLVRHGLTWKAYEESLPHAGADRVDYSDGVYTDTTDFTTIKPTLNPPLTQADVVALYAVKHNPFAYFKAVQDGTNPMLSLTRSVDFDGAGGLYADLGSGDVPSYSFIAPNQCNDQHGRGNAGAFCNYDPKSDGKKGSLNPALIYRGDITVKKIVGAIHNSPVWKSGQNAIVLVWDENDYSTAPNTNQVIAVVDTNYGMHGVASGKFYTHFSLLKSIQAGFGLPCLNNTCDSSVAVMSDLFAK